MRRVIAALLTTCCILALFFFVVAEAREAPPSAAAVAIQTEIATTSGILQADSFALRQYSFEPSPGQFWRFPSVARACITGGPCKSTYDCCAGYQCRLERLHRRYCVR
jgi:hypothetical protein